MSVISIVATDLNSLLSELRRRNSEIKKTTEQSIELINKFNPSSDSEKRYIENLAISYPQFISPFILSLQSKSVKLSTISLHCLHALFQYKSIPITRINELLQALTEAASHLPMEVQLKVLQLLPAIFVLYKYDLHGPVISQILNVCAILQAPGRSSVVVNTAAATLQQLVIFVFDKVQEIHSIDNDHENLQEEDLKNEVLIDNNKFLFVSDDVFDAYRIFDDLCSLYEHSKPAFLEFSHLSDHLVLELIESILANFTSVFANHNELAFLLRFKVTPILLRSISLASSDFPTIVRICRIVVLLVKRNLTVLKVECEIILSLLDHILIQKDTPKWKIFLILEVQCSLFNEVSLVLKIFEYYDNSPDKKNVINDFLVNVYYLVNSSSAKKYLKYTSVLHEPSSSILLKEQTGKLNLMEMLDKLEPPPEIPYTIHILAIILKCFTTISDNIGKFIIDSPPPDTLSNASKKKFNDKSTSKLSLELGYCQNWIINNYKVLIAVFEIFLYSNISNEAFHQLVRALQKICYSSGILELSEPRDEIILLFIVASINNNETVMDGNLKGFGSPTIDEKIVKDLPATSVDTQQQQQQKKSQDMHSSNLQSQSIGETLFGSLSSRFSLHANSLATTISNVTSNPSSPIFSKSPTVASFFSTINTESSAQPVLHSRYISSRHLITFRALLNLGILLGPSLVGHNWELILIALQWIDYYMNGPSMDEIELRKWTYDKHSKYGYLPNVKSTELQAFVTSIKKLTESTVQYSKNSFIKFLKNIICLSEITFKNASISENDEYYDIAFTIFTNTGISSKKSAGSTQILEDVNISPCYYNRLYFLKLLSEVLQLNSNRFLNECKKLLLANDHKSKPSSFLEATSYFSSLIVDRKLGSEFRLQAISFFNKFLMSISKELVSNKVDDKLCLEMELRLLRALFEILSKIYYLNANDIVMLNIKEVETIDELNLNKIVNSEIVNCEFNMISLCLESFKEILDTFEVKFDKDSWNIIFDIIDSSFDVFNVEETITKNSLTINLLILLNVNSKYMIMDKKSKLLRDAFDILQLILSDFLNDLPLNTTKKLITTIFRFTDQAYEINISFSAISYFWQVSDYLRNYLMVRNLAMSSLDSSQLTSSIMNNKQLLDYVNIKIVDRENDSSVTVSNCAVLWLYLLSVLIEISNDTKGQVRNGAIQTFFKIIDSHGKDLICSWELCYNIVILKLFDIKPRKILKNTDWEKLAVIKKEWSESVILIIEGIVKLYMIHFTDFSESQDQRIRFWKGLINYFEEMLKYGWNDCDLKLYESFAELLKPFTGEDNKCESIPLEVVIQLFDFWSSRNVSYNVTINKNYQDSLSALMKSFTKLYVIMKQKKLLNHLRVSKALVLFNSAVRYPILPTFFNDNVYPTDLQKTVLENLRLIIKNDNSEVQSDIMLQLVSNVVLPFSTRQRIKEKLNNSTELPKDTKVSSFIALSYHSVAILEDLLGQLRDYKSLLLGQNAGIKLIGAFMEPIKLNAKGLNKKKLQNRTNLQASSKELWEECTLIVLKVLNELTKVIISDDKPEISDIDMDSKRQFWNLMVELHKTILFINSNNLDYESFNISCLNKLQNMIISCAATKSFSSRLLPMFSQYILNSSYLYDRDDLEKVLLEEDRKSGQPLIFDQIIDNFIRYDWDSNNLSINQPLVINAKYKIGLLCLNNLIEFSKMPLLEDKLDELKYFSKKLISESCLDGFMVRFLYILRKYISLNSALGDMPIPKIHHLEVVMVLKGSIMLIKNFKRAERSISKLRITLPYVIKVATMPHTLKYRNISLLSEELLKCLSIPTKNCSS